MVSEIRQKRCISHRSNDSVTQSDATLGRISNPWHDEVLRYGICRRRSPVSSLLLRRMPHRRSARRRPRRSSTTANSNARPRRGPDLLSSNTSSLSNKLLLQVHSHHAISASMRILHSIILIVGIRRALGCICHGLTFCKAIGSALASTATTLTKHLQRRQQQDIQESEKPGKFHTKKKKREEKKNTQ